MKCKWKIQRSLQEAHEEEYFLYTYRTQRAHLAYLA